MSTRPCVLTQRTINSKAIRAVKLLQYVIANLNLKGFSFFIHVDCVQGESKKSDDCDMYNRNVIPCGV